MTACCSICKRTLNVPSEPDSLDCGGDCVRCMAESGDPGCIEAMNEFQVEGRVKDWAPPAD